MADNSRIIGSALENLVRRDARERLNKNIHFVPINIEALKVTLKQILSTDIMDVIDPSIPKEELEAYKKANADLVISIEEFRNKIVRYVEGKHKNVINLDNYTSSGKALTNVDKLPPSRIYLGGELVGVAYSSYDKASTNLFRVFLNKELNVFIKQSIYRVEKAQNYVRRFNVGHILDVQQARLSTKTQGPSDIATSPLLEGLIDSLKLLERLLAGDTTAIPNITSDTLKDRRLDLQNLKDALSTRLDFLATRAHYGPRIKATLSKEVTKFLEINGGLVVIIQDEFENQYTFGTLVEGLTSSEVLKLFVNTNFSDTIVQEVEKRTAELIRSGKFLQGTGKKKKALKDITPVINVKTTLYSPKVKTIKKTKQNIRLRTQTGQFYSLASLQKLLDTLLVLKVKENMGDGSRRDILNLRSGRFAESVKVERLSQSREGMITAFYTYMKNPYATFSDGGRQQYPRSRDPKLLIAKSIREIAATKVDNRMRAVAL